MSISDMLRGWAKRSNQPQIEACESYFHDAYVDDYICDMQKLFRDLADEIDRCYVPRQDVFDSAGVRISIGDVIAIDSLECLHEDMTKTEQPTRREFRQFTQRLGNLVASQPGGVR